MLLLKLINYIFRWHEGGKIYNLIIIVIKNNNNLLFVNVS